MLKKYSYLQLFLIIFLTFQNYYHIVVFMEINELSNRQLKIYEAIKENPNINVMDISTLTDVAPATVRRDLTKLSELNYIQKSYGKLSVIDPIKKRINDNTSTLSNEQLDLIKTTVKQIHSGNVVLLNYSELNCIIADELLLSDKNITIVTNSLRIFDRTKDSTHINNILLAGLYNKETKAFSGTTTYSILSTLRADCFVMHPSGIDFQLGFLADPTEDLPLLQNMLNVARKVILYIDESCIEKKSGLLVSNFNLVNTIVINKKIYEKYKDELSLFDFKIVITEE